MGDVAGRVVEQFFDVVQAVDRPDARSELGPDRRQIDDPRDPVGADRGCRGLAEAILERPHVVGAVARRRHPKKGVHVLRRLDQEVRIVLGADGNLAPRSANLLSFSGRRPNNFTLTSPPKSKRKSATALPTCPVGVVMAIFIAFSFSQRNSLFGVAKTNTIKFRLPPYEGDH